MSTHAVLVGKHSTVWASLFTVTGVLRRVLTSMLSLAWLLAFWRFGTASDRRVQYRLTTVAGQLIKSSSPTWWTKSNMTDFIALVSAAWQFLPTDDIASMFMVSTAFLIALVASTLPLLIALPLTQNWFSFFQFNTWHILLGCSAPTFDGRCFLAWRTGTGVTFHHAQVRRTFRTTVKFLPTKSVTSRYWIFA